MLGSESEGIGLAFTDREECDMSFVIFESFVKFLNKNLLLLFRLLNCAGAGAGEDSGLGTKFV